MDLFERRSKKRYDSVENNIRYIKSKGDDMTSYDKGMLQALEEELSCRTVELGLYNEGLRSS